MNEIEVEFTWEGKQWKGELSEVFYTGGNHWRLYVKKYGVGELYWRDYRGGFIFNTQRKGEIPEMAEFLGKFLLQNGWKPPIKKEDH